METRQILYSHVVLPYTEEYQGNLANVNKYMYTLCRFNLIIVRIACAVYVTTYECVHEKTRQEVIQLKSPILLKLGTNVGFGE